MEAPTGDLDADWDTLFSPPSLSVLLLSCSANSTGRIDQLLKVKIRDICTAFLVLYNQETGGDELLFVLDLRACIYKEKEEIDNDRNLCSIFYQIERDGTMIQFEVIPTSADGIRDVQAFDFILGQYAMKDDSMNKDGIICEGKDRNPNVVAQGFESTGMAVRVALRSGGRYTGHAIRYLGQQYTSIVSAALGKVEEDGAENKRTTSGDPTDGTVERSASDDPERPSMEESEVERANRRRQWAEGVHSAATSLTGAVLYPVRWTGRVAAELGGKGGSDRPNSENALSKVFLDTVGGIGNGMMSVCKGVTEAIGEVGSAIGDSAMHHSVAMHGNEYADTVTKQYVDAASEIGLAGYKVANVAALGWQGVLVNAALEGTTFLVSLYEYLMGPVLLQGYMEMMQMPMLKVERFFVVLRPWSIAFYRSAADITRKPYKVVATSMLDTLPKLRIRAVGTVPRSPAADMLSSTLSTESAAEHRKAGSPAPVSGQKLERDDARGDGNGEEEQEEDFSYWHRSDYEAFESPAPSPAPAPVPVAQSCSADKKEAEVDGVCCTGSAAPAAGTYSMSVALDRTKQDFKSAITQLSGGETSHIELCTVDCSTFILYPPSDTIQLWYRELFAATSRVETIAKRKSGADEIALFRRLEMFPISSYVEIKVKRFIRSTPKPSMFDMFIRKRSALNTGAADELLLTQDQQQAQEQELAGNCEGSPIGAGQQPPPAGEKLDASAARPETTASNSSDDEYHNAKTGGLDELETPDLPVAKEVGNLSDDEDVYECSDFWEAESPDLLSGSYFEIVPEDREQPDAAAYPAIPSGSSDGSPSPVPASSHLYMEAVGCTAASADGVSGEAVGSGERKEPSAVQSDESPVPSLPLSTDVTQVNRAFFAPEVQCSVYPVTKNGTVLLMDKHRIPRAPLMTVQQYLAELQSMISALSRMIAGSTEEVPAVAIASSTAAGADTAANAASDDEADLRHLRIQQLESLQRNYDTYALVNPEKFISDWEVYNHLIGVVEVGKSVNVFSSKDVSKIEIKLNRRHSQLSHFSEWGTAEVPILDIPQAVSGTAAGSETWVPVFRRATGEQLGVLLIEICRKDL